MKLWLNHPALWERMQDDCFQLIRGVGNPYEATLYLRTRAERISVMLLLHLTLILQKPMSVHTQWVTTPSLLESDEVAQGHIYHFCQSRCATNVPSCLPSAPHMHTHTHHLSFSVVPSLRHTSTHKKKERNPPLSHIFQIARATTSTHKHIWHMQLNLGQLQQRALLWVKSSITPHEEECLVDHKSMWKQNT